MTARVFIDGAAGTTGLEIASRLADRPEFSVITLDEDQRRQAAARHDALNAADFVILCLPDEAARDAVAMIDNPHVRVIDASTAHRVAAGWTYGFPELGNDVASAARVSNPGCYATGFIALVAPLVRAGLIARDARLTCNAVSGYSGGGKAMIAEFEGGAPTAWRGYALGMAHKHLPEMRLHAGLAEAPLFAPAVVSTYRGMIVDVPLFDIDAPRVRDILAAAYADCAVVRLAQAGDDAVTIEQAADSDRMDLFVLGNGTRTRLIAALDNLGKGASGAAVQNLNLMAGLPETAGLRL